MREEKLLPLVVYISTPQYYMLTERVDQKQNPFWFKSANKTIIKFMLLESVYIRFKPSILGVFRLSDWFHVTYEVNIILSKGVCAEKKGREGTPIKLFWSKTEAVAKTWMERCEERY